MRRFTPKAALIILLGLTYGSLSTLGFDKTADLYVILIGMVLFYNAMVRR